MKDGGVWVKFCHLCIFLITVTCWLKLQRVRADNGSAGRRQELVQISSWFTPENDPAHSTAPPNLELNGLDWDDFQRSSGPNLSGFVTLPGLAGLFLLKEEIHSIGLSFAVFLLLLLFSNKQGFLACNFNLSFWRGARLNSTCVVADSHQHLSWVFSASYF